MKAFVMGAGGAVVIAAIAAVVLQSYVNKPVEQAYTTSSARIAVR
jgi:hypothetical protein